MKIRLLGILVFSLFQFLAKAQQLIAYYPLNGNSNDHSGYNHHGTASNTILDNDRFGMANKAYQFNNSNSKIEIPNDALFDLTQQFSASAWVKASTVPDAYNASSGFSIISKDYGAGNNNPKWIFALQNGGLAFHFNGPGYGTGFWVYSNPFTLNLNEWYHYAFSKSGNQITFYLNGKQIGTSSLPNAVVNPNAPLTLGYSEPSATLSGSLDEVKLYNYAISAYEAAGDYSNGSLVLSLPFNGNANDLSGLNNNGTLHGTPIFITDRFGSANSAIQFNGNPSNYISILNSNLLQLTNKYTLSAWVKISQFNTANCQANFIIAKGAQTSEGHYNLQYGDFLDGNCGGYSPTLEQFASTIRKGGTEQSVFENPLSQTVITDRWYWVVCTVDGNDMRLYVNGKLRSTKTLSGTFGALNTQNLFIGKSHDINAYPVNGIVDDIKVYNAALSAEHIFDTYINDLKKPGSGNAIVLTGTGSITTSPYLNVGKGFDFGAQPFTWESWVKRNSFGTTLNNYGKAFFVGDLNNSWGLGVVNDNKLFLTKVGVNAVFSTGTLSDTNWHHVAVVYTGSQIIFYIDGNVVGTQAYTSTFNNTSGNYLIGARQSFGNSNGDQTPDSYLDEMRIWRNVALNQTQIRDWMCRKLNSTHPAFGNLFACFRFDELNGNLSGGYNGNFGLFVNSPIRSTSAAPLGDASANDYINAIKSVSISHQSGESFSVTSSTGSPSGIQVYRVDEQPNTLNGSAGVGGNNKYFGVFQVGGSSPVYNAIYNYAGNPFVTPAIENTLRLFQRNNNASLSWAPNINTPNEIANTISASSQNAEFILGKNGTPFQSPINLTLFLQGYFTNPLMVPALMNQGIGTSSTITDTIQVNLYAASFPYNLIHTTKTLLNSNGTATCNMPVIPGYYYLGIKHRNTLETWTSEPVPVNSSVALNYNFTADSSKAYGANLIELKPGTWGLYTGDLNQEENIDLLDAAILENEISIFSSGYQAADLNGDGNVDLLDSPMLEANLNNFIYSIKP